MSISLINPHDFITEEIILERKQQINIATEIYLTKQCARIHYGDLMDDVGDEFASKSMLISWLNDYVRNNKVVRPGILNLYFLQRGDHFKNGKWMSCHIWDYILFAAKKLTDPIFLKDKKKAIKFRNSFSNNDWFNKATALMALKLLDDLNEKRALCSALASAMLNEKTIIRKTLEKQGLIIGRAAKNQKLDENFITEIRESNQQLIKALWDNQIKMAEQHEEHKILDRYESELNRAFRLVHQNICEHLLGYSTKAVM